ncbi:hypothetical protein HPB48_022450 [Haemaphysalis longicornis]|uniref:STAS domain-containing protein n=1 Tax=Haemaphysalis longicornis TaxID=44386 RepID=A0A9J6G328_HAELO|nr:hypothetical protein HPB48_022450 [Haemaphysalis longicornis]
MNFTRTGPNMIRRLSKSDKYDLRLPGATTPHHRPVFTQPHFESEFAGIPKGKVPICDRMTSTVRKRLHIKQVQKKLLGLFPIIGWVRHYNLKEWLVSDIIAGISVAIFHVPQSAFAVVCMMTGAVVEQYKEEYGAANVATTLMFFVGLYQLALGFLNLGGLSVFLSEQFVSGFTAGVSFHIGSSQLGSLFGLKVDHFSGPFLLIRLYAQFFSLLPETHLPTLALSAVCIFILLFVKLAIDPFVERKIRMPLPTELLLVIAGTLVSRFMDLEHKHFDVIKHIPNTFPKPGLPVLDLTLVSKVAVPALTIAVVAFAVTVSLGRIFARRHGYEVVPNQELLALGISNFFGSFFSCFPSGASVPRSSIQDNVGGKTQLVSIINSVLIAIVLLYLGSYLEKLPVAVLAAIIFVSLKKVFMQIRDFWNFWLISKIDGQVWLVTFFATIILEVQLGLVIGVVFSLLTLVYKIQRPSTCLLGQIPNTDYYVPIKKYGMESTSPPYDELSDSMNSLPSTVAIDGASSSSSSLNSSTSPPTGLLELPRHVVLDFSRVTFVDGSSVVVLKQVFNEFMSIGIGVYIACCSVTAWDCPQEDSGATESAGMPYWIFGRKVRDIGIRTKEGRHRPSKCHSLMARSFRFHSWLCRLCGCFFIKNLYGRKDRLNPKVVWKSWYTIYATGCLAFIMWLDIGPLVTNGREAVRKRDKLHISLRVFMDAILLISKQETLPGLYVDQDRVHNVLLLRLRQRARRLLEGFKVRCLRKYIGSQLRVLRECVNIQGTGRFRCVDLPERLEAVRAQPSTIRQLKEEINDVWRWPLVVSSVCVLLVLCSCMYEVCREEFVLLNRISTVLYAAYITYEFMKLAFVSQNLINMAKAVKDTCKTVRSIEDSYFRHQIRHLYDTIDPEDMALKGADFFKLDVSLLVSVKDPILKHFCSDVK